MTFWTALRRSYSEAWGFILAVPLIAAAAIGFEGLQHAVEYAEGLYVSSAAMHAHGADAGRMIAGVAKVGWLLLLQYWVTRYVVGGSARAAVARDPGAIRQFSLVFTVSAAAGVVQIFLPQLLAAAGVAGRPMVFAILAGMGLSFILGALLVPWAVGAALGTPRAWSLARRAPGSILWAIALGLATGLPLVVVHYAFGYAAVGRPAYLTVAILAVDAVFTSFIGVVAATSQVMIADRMARRAGGRLVYGPLGEPTPLAGYV